MRHHVLRLQVVVYQAAVVHQLQSVEHLQSDGDYGLQLEPTLARDEESLEIQVVLGHHDEVESSVLEDAIGQEFRK